jgi:hypothetical protein
VKTELLIDLLAHEEARVDTRSARARVAVQLLAIALLPFAALLLVLGPSAQWPELAAQPGYWIKIGFAAWLAACAGLMLRRCGYPGAEPGRLGPWMAAAVGLLWLYAAVMLWRTPAGAREAMVMGASAWRCAVAILALALPGLVAAFAVLRRLAPTRLRLAGAAAGLFAGASGALAYGVYCQELSPAFVATWYVLGIALAAGVGCAAGRRALRW